MSNMRICEIYAQTPKNKAESYGLIFLNIDRVSCLFLLNDFFTLNIYMLRLLYLRAITSNIIMIIK